MQTLLVTGGAGFIGANFVRQQVAAGRRIVTLDALTYAGNVDNLAGVVDDTAHTFVKGSINDCALWDALLQTHQPDAVVHFAAESHVDRSIDAPGAFIDTNILGTYAMLESLRKFSGGLSGGKREAFRLLHVSTDEVYGSLGASGKFTEASPYKPNSPYAASKAASDHLVRAYAQTYGLPAIITHCSNNYGPYQFPEKLIPHMLRCALAGLPLPIYGDGLQVRDWIYVADHCRALGAVLAGGRRGETYNIGGGNEMANLDLVRLLCRLLDEKAPSPAGSYRRLVTFVADRPGHDRRYAIDASRMREDLGWAPQESFATGLAKTVDWYLENAGWCDRIVSGAYRLQRLGLF